MTTHSARVLADSVSPAGHRLTTLEVVIPRIVLAELNTHKMVGKNSASSRAIPVEQQIRRAETDPFVPAAFESNRKGMQGGAALEGEEAQKALNAWHDGIEYAAWIARKLAACGVHKGYANRVLEPYLWHTCILSATEWSNLIALRCHPAAHPDFRTSAEHLRDAMAVSRPRVLRDGEWHLPLVEDEEVASIAKREDWLFWAKVSAARCARVSYMAHEKRELEKDVDRYETLRSSGHLSPLEHPARPMTERELDLFRRHRHWWNEDIGDWDWTYGDYTYFLGNVQGFVQLRKMIPNEHDFSLVAR